MASTLNSSLNKVSTIRLAPKIGGTMSTSVGTNESGAVSSDCLVIFKQPSRASTADPYQIQYRVINKYDNANKKKYGADYDSTWAAAPWKNAIAVTGISLNSTSDPKYWQKSNRAVNTSSDYQSVLNLKNTVLSSGTVARCYQFRIRTYNKKTNRHGAWVSSSALTINRAATMTGDAVHISNGLLLGFNLMWNGDKGTFNVDSVKVNGTEILLNKISGAQLTVINYRTSETHPPKPASGYTGYNCLIPKASLTKAGYAALQSATQVKITAYYKTPAGAKTYFGDKSGAVMPILNEDIDLAKPVIVSSFYADTGRAYIKAYKGESTDVVGKAVAHMQYFDERSSKWVDVKQDSVEGTVATVTAKGVANEVPLFYRFSPPFNARIKAWVNFYGAAKDGYVQSNVVQFTNAVGNLFLITNANDLTHDELATLVGEPELTVSREPIKSIYHCFNRRDPVVAFSGNVERKLTLKGFVFDVPDGNDGILHYATTEQWLKIADKSKLRTLRTPDSRVFKVAIDSVDINRRFIDQSEITVTMTEVS